MEIPSGPFKYKSAHPPQPLSEEEEAALVFSAAGLSGYALADLSYGKGEERIAQVAAAVEELTDIAHVSISSAGPAAIKRLAAAELRPGRVCPRQDQLNAKDLSVHGRLASKT